MPARRRHRSAKSGPTTSASVWTLESLPDVDRLVEEVFSPDRYDPLILVSQAGDTKQPRVDVEELRTAVGNRTLIAVLPAGEGAWEFSNKVPDHFRSYGGAVRLCWPQAKPTDSVTRHPLFVTHTHEDSPRTIARIVRTLHDRGYLEESSSGPSWSQDDAVPAEDPTKEQVRRDLSTALERIAALTSENTELRKTVRGLNDQVSLLHQRLHGTRLFADPQTQLRYEIRHAWLITYTEADRERYPLAAYTFGPEFLDSVNGLEGIERDKIVSACVDVLTRRAWEINGRNARRYRTSSASGAPNLVRESDAATAWRCNLQTGTASARRMMWWDKPDGSIELAVVTVHDDYTLR